MNLGPGLLDVAILGGATLAAVGFSRSSSSSADLTPPVAQSVSANSAAGTVILTYNKPLDPNHLPPASAFSVTTNGLANSVSEVAVNGNVMTLKLANAFSSGALTIGYTDPSAGDDLNAIQDLAGRDASGFLQGLVVDGYIRGAEIFLDINGNGVADAGESTGVFTRADGSFFLSATRPNAAIIAVGGVNIDTGLPQLTPLAAPAGAGVINPLTTLVLAVMQDAAGQGAKLDATEASDAVARFLRIKVPEGQSLVNLDPLAVSGDEWGLAAQQTAAQMATIVNLAAGADAVTARTIISNAARAVMTSRDSGLTVDLGGLGEADLATLLSGTSIQPGTMGVLIGNIVAATQAIEGTGSAQSISSAQLNAAQGGYRDTAAPLAATMRLASDSGESGSDGISDSGLIRVDLDYSQAFSESDAWEYSTDGGGTWAAGGGSGFLLAEGTYAANAIRVRQTDHAGNATVSPLNRAITIDRTAPVGGTGLSLKADTGVANDGITADGTINVALGPDTRSWSYSTNFGGSWTAGDGHSFLVGNGSYASGSIQLKEFDAAGNSRVSALDLNLIVTTASVANAPPVVADVNPPSWLSASTTGVRSLALVFDERLVGDQAPIASSFAVQSDAIPNPITQVDVSGNVITLTLARDIPGSVVTVSYRDPSDGNDARAIQDRLGNDAASFKLAMASGSAAPDLLAMSGGGFKALTADAGMLAGVLKYFRTHGDAGIDVASLLDDRMALSANSGSTWFLDLLAYSPSFIQGLNHYDTLFSTDSEKGDLSVEQNPAGKVYGATDGFFGVMGEAYKSYMNVDVEAYLRDILVRVQRINSLGSFLDFLMDAPDILNKMLVVAAGDSFEKLMDIFAAQPYLGPVLTKLRDFFSAVSDISDALVLLATRGLDWNTFMQEIVFAPDGLDRTLQQINFHDGNGRNSALDTQSLVYALAVSSDRAAIGASDFWPAKDDTVFATVTNSEASYGGFKAVYNFLPATATSLGNSTDRPAPWLPSIKSGDLKVEYNGADWFDWGARKTYDDLDFKGLSAFLSSSISSSAAAVAGSDGALGSGVVGAVITGIDILTLGKFKDGLYDYLKGLSPLVKIAQNPNGPDSAGDPVYFPKGVFSDPIASEITSKQAASAGYLRMADGGYFDNTGLEAGLAYLEANQSSWVAGDHLKDFDITLFVVEALNPSRPPGKGLEHFGAIGGTVERLFKGGAQMTAPVDISHPNSAVFDSAIDKVSGVGAPVWSHASANAPFKLNAWEFQVETIAGNTMNIGAGYNGTVHCWTIQSPTEAIPLATLGSWSDYEAMYGQIIAALQTADPLTGVIGAELLGRQLGYTAVI